MRNIFTSVRTFSNHHPLIKGTILLTGAGFLSRIIGFFYRIYLSRLFGEESMGIYQLIHPISALAFSLTAASFQTAISRFVASQTQHPSSSKIHDGKAQKSYRPMLMGASIAIPLSLAVALALYHLATPIAEYYLLEPRTAPLIRLLAYTIPFSTAHACLNGYFYGIQKAEVPAWTQLAEQFFRVGFVFLISSLYYQPRNTPPLSIAVIGLIIGEIAGLAGTFIALIHSRTKELFSNTSYMTSPVTYKALLTMIIPLSANRVFLNILQSIEAVSLPACLRAYGYDNTTALSIYGVLTGMAFPLIFFPNALTGSVSVVLLPVISENMALGKKEEIKKSVIQTIQYCSILGFFCMSAFLFFGRQIGIKIFQSSLAGYYIGQLSFLCPFLYLNNTLSGVLQGLGKANSLFITNLVTLTLRLLIIFGTVPTLGMKGYFWGLLISQILQSILYLFILFYKKSLNTHTESSKLPNKYQNTKEV